MTHECDLCREDGDGAVISIDVHARLLPDEVDLLLADIDHDPDEYGLDGAPYRGFDVVLAVRRSVHPLDCDDPDGEDCWCDYQEWLYDPVDDGSAGIGPLAEGEVLVTRLVVDTSWRHRCYRHRDRVARTGVPADSVAEPEPDEDPTPTVGGYLYMCADCHDRFDARVQVQRKLWMVEVERRRVAGVPEHLLYD